jgi:hypothetical protein
MALTKASFSVVEGTPLSVLDFGADPLGVADSTSAIQTAINQGLATNQPVFIPAGNYRISSVITLSSSPTPYLTGVKIFGAGMRQSVLKCYSTAFVQSNQTQVNDNIQLSDFGIVNVSSSATRGLDIGTVRGSLFVNLEVKNFLSCFAVRGNQGVGNWWNRFYNCEAVSTGLAVVGSKGWELGNDGTNVPTTGLPNIPDLDYADFYGCKAFDCESAITAFNIIGCVISGFLANSSATALQFYKGNNNYIELNGEAVSNMGFAQGPTLANDLRLYSDGRLATDFDDGGLNQVNNQILAQPTLPNTYRTLDCFAQDRLGVSFTAASQNIFQIAFTSVEAAVTVTTTSCGYIVGTSEFASVQVWDITRTASGAFTVTPIRTTGTAGVLTATAGSGNVVFAMAGNASAALVGQVIVDVQGVGVIQTYPFMQSLGYLRV